MKVRKLIDSFNYAIEGISYALKTQRNMKIHFLAAILVLVFCLFFNLSRIELIAILATITMVIVAEMINTAIEAVVDLLTDTYHPLAKVAKNVAAGAVLITAVNSLFVAYIIFFDKINPLTNIVLTRIRESPAHITFISLIVVMFASIILKTHFGKGTPMRGGMPSAHSAIAFCLATAITFISANTLISTIGFLLAFMVAQSRIEGGIHTTFQTMLGAALGILITVLFFQIVK